MTPVNPRAPKWLGPALIVISLLIMRFGKPSSGVAPWVAYLAASTYLMAGLILIAQSLDISWLANVIGSIMVISFAIIPSWIAFAPGGRECTSFLSILFFWQKHVASGMGCRVPFGMAAVVMWIAAIVMIVSVWTKKGKP